MLRFVVAAGWIKTPSEAEKYHGCADELVLGSFTPRSREGNTGGTSFDNSADFSFVLNSIGLKNQSLAVAIEEFAGRFDLSSQTSMMRVSIAGFSIRDYAGMMRLLHAAGIRRWELNIGCPNSGASERILSFDPDGIEKLLAALHTALAQEKRPPYVAIKPSPYSDPHLLKEVAQLFNTSRFINEVVVSNTFPNARAYRADKKPWIEVAGGFAGYSGGGMKPIALGQVAQFREHLHPRISVAGSGGIRSGMDAQDFELAGASSVHIGSTAFLRGGRAVNQIMHEYVNIRE